MRLLRAVRVRTAIFLAVALPLLLLQIAHAGTLSSVAPAAASIGVAININGTGYDPTAGNNVVTFTPASGAPVTATPTGIALLDATTGARRLTVKVPAGLPVGPSALRVTNQVTGEISEGRSIQVVALSLPDTTGADPGATALKVRITGSSNVTFAPTGTRASFGAGITVAGVTVESANRIIATINVASAAVAGPRDVTVISGSLTAIAPSAFAVTAPTANRPPIANAGGPYGATVGQTLTFDGTHSSDPDGGALTYSWNFGDSTPAATGATVTHSYAVTGDYPVTLTVTDPQGAFATATVTARIGSVNHDPVAAIGGPYSGVAGQAVIVSAAGSSDPDGDPLTYTFNFGDGSAPVTTMSPPVAHVYSAAGDFTMSLSVADGRGGVGNATTTAHITPQNRPPVASIGGPYSGTAGQPVVISAAASSDPDGDSLTYTFNFGDGTAPLTTTATVSHTFAAAGDFAVSVTVADGRGGTTPASTTAHIVAPTNAAPVVSAGPNQTITLPSGAALAGSVTDDGLPAGSIVTSTWSMISGPGTVAFANGASPATTATFSRDGTYVLRLTASDTALSSTADVTITVNPVPNHAPQITSTPVTAARHEFAYTYQVTAADSDGDALTFSLPVAPAGMAIDPTGRIEWKPTGNQVGAQAVTVAVTDTKNATATQPFTITVSDVTPPFVSLTAPNQAQAGNDVTVSAQATDNVGVASVVIDINGGNPVTLQSAPYSRVISVPQGTAVGTTFHIRATARDAAGNTATDDKTFAVAAAPDTQNPTITLNAPATALAGATVHLSATAADNVGVASVAFTAGTTPLATVTAPPFEAEYVVPPGAAAGTQIAFSARATDFSGNFADAPASITVSDVPDTTPPSVDLTAPLSVPERGLLSLSSNASDASGVEHVAFFVNGVTVAVVVAPPYQTTYKLAAGIAGGDTLHVEARARDFAGNEASTSTETVVTAGPANHLPIANAGGPYSGQAGDAIVFSSAGTSDPDDDQLVLDWDFGDATHGTGPSPSHAYNAAGSYTVTLTVSDGNGGSVSVSASAVITAPTDVTPPVVTMNAPATALPGSKVTVTAFPVDDKSVAGVTFEVNAANPTDVTVPPYQRVIDVAPVATPGDTIAVRATARDAAGNTGTANAAITIATQPDTENPAVTLSAPLQAAPGTSIQLGAIATDNVGVASVAFVVNGSTLATVAAPPYQATFPIAADVVPGTALSIVARATDFSGNHADASASVTIVAVSEQDTQPPSVTLSASLTTVAGQSLPLSATAADNVAVASVAFFVEGMKIATRLTPPYQATFAVPSTTPNATTLHLQAIATDASGLTAAASATTQVIAASQLGRGIVTGEVYDDTTGLPASGVPVMLVGNDSGGAAYSATTSTDSRGRFVLRGREGQAVVRVGGTGTTIVDRIAAISANQALEIFDARVTPLGAATTITTVLGGALSFSEGSLTIPAGALGTDAQLSFTSVGPQGLQGLLPVGWSPAAAVDVSPHGKVFTGGAGLSVVSAASLLPGTAVVFATWDESVAGWRAVAVTTIANASAPLQATIATSGQYAWLVADTIPAAPPAPSAGDLVAGVSAVDVPVGALTTVTPQPKVAFYKPGLRVPVSGVVNSNGALPSGTPIQTRLTESYLFASGAEAHLDPFVEDLVFYLLGADAGATRGTFLVTPSLTFEAINLQKGVISVELLAPAAGPRLVPIVDTTGGTVQSSTGESIVIPAGAVVDPLPVQITRVAPDQIGVVLPSPLEFVAAVDVAFTGALNAPAALSVATPAGIAADAQLLLVRVQEIAGQSRLVFVAAASINGDHIVSDVAIGTVGGTPEGIRVPGRYLLLRSTTAFGYATGHVLGVNNSGAVAGALVTSSNMPTASLAGADGAYASAVLVGAVTLTAQDLLKNDSGSASTNIAAARSVATADLSLVAQVPHVVSTTPADNATGVALSDPLRVAFSEPIDPATVNGANAANVLLTAPDASAVAGAIALTAGNTALTFRPAAPLAANTTYAFAIAGAITDVSGNPLASAVTIHFTTLNTEPPPAPPAGSINASIPNSSGQTTIVATQGSAGLHDTVTILNVTHQAVYPVLIDPNGGFTVTVAAAITDKLQVVITGPNGGQTVVDLPRFEQVNADGSLSTAITSEGGHIDGPGGVGVDVPSGAFPDGAVVTVKPIAEADFPVQLDDNAKQQITFAGAIQLDLGGKTPEKYINVSIPAGPDDKVTDQWVLSQVRDDNGLQSLSIVDTAKLIDGKIRTSSPPCPGVAAQGVYGFHKTNREVGLNYGQMYSNGYGGLALKVDYPFLSFMMAPYGVFEPVIPSPVCYPVLTGHVTVSENSQRIVIAPDQLTPADREIVITNTTRTTETRYPRNVLEFTFEVTGVSTDSYHATIVSASGTQPATSVEVTTATPTTVLIHLNPDTVPVSVTSVTVTNVTRSTTTTFPVDQVALKLKAPGGSGDTYDVAIINAAGVQRQPTFSIESPSGAGNLVVHAVQGTIDPTQAEIDAYNSSHPGSPIYAVGRSEVLLYNETAQTSTTIPDNLIVDGAFSYDFNGNVSDQFAIEVIYDDGKRDYTRLPNFRITVRNRTTGRVIKTIVGQAPPRDEPLNLGVLSDDSEPPMLTAGPPRMTNYDPASPLTFTFSEAMNAQSLKDGLIVEWVQGSGQRVRVDGKVRVSAGNTVATFVPTTSLRIGAEYSVTFIGRDQLGSLLVPGGTAITDRSGNSLGTTRFQLKTFKPRKVGTFAADVDYSGAKIGIRDVEIRRKKVGNQQKTYVYAVAESPGGYRYATFDVTDPANPTKLGTVPVGGSGKKQLAVLSDLGGANPAIPTRTTFTKCDGTSSSSFTGDLAVTIAFNVYYSYLTFFDTTDPANPCTLAGRLLTATPDTLSDYNRRGTVHALGFAYGVATIQHSQGYAAYTAVRDVGLFATDIGKNIPEYNPYERVKEGVYAGNYWDVVNVNDKLLALNRDTQQIEVFDPNLALLGSVDLPEPPRRIRTIQGFPVDVNQNGIIEPDEQFDLAFVSTDNPSTGVATLQIVDITNLDEMKVVGSIPMPGITNDLQVDKDRFRLFARSNMPTGGYAFLMLDISNPFRGGSIDFDQDGLDDRIIWNQPYPSGISGFRIDSNRGLAYVGHPGGLDVWAIYELCCDLSVDMAAKPDPGQSGDRAGLLAKERQALLQEIQNGLGDAGSQCGVSASSLSILEQGSGACLWKKNPNTGQPDPVAACTTTYQPGLSDHDYEVLFPAGFADSTQACVTKALSGRFTDPVTKKPKEIQLPGNQAPIEFNDVTFFPFSKDDFESGRMNVLPPRSAGGDATGDLGLGRRQLLLLWLLGGEYVPAAGLAPGRAQDAILRDLLNDSSLGIKPLEGYEWAKLQTFNLAKAKVFLRVSGASRTDSSLHAFYVKQLHDAAKAAVRTAFGRLIADPAGNTSFRTMTRDIYNTNGCIGVDPAVNDPNAWAEKPCTSFEEFAQSAIAKTVRGAAPLSIFTVAEVQNIARFYRVKADLEQITSDAAADAFIALAASFIENAATLTEPVYTRDIQADPDRAQRDANIQSALTLGDKALKKTYLVLEPHVANRGFRSAAQVELAMYLTDAAASGTQYKSFDIDLAGGEDRYYDYEHNDDGSLKLDPNGDPIPVFLLGPDPQNARPNPVDLTALTPGQVHGVSFTIDLPDKTIKEAYRKNNVGGFFYYRLDVANPTRPTIPPSAYLPLPDPSVLDPDTQCDEPPAPRVSEAVIYNNQTYTDTLFVATNTPITIRLTVDNTGGEAMTSAKACSAITRQCYDIGPVGANATVTYDVTFTTPAVGQRFEGAPTFQSEAAGIVQGGTFALVVGCEAWRIIPLENDPNPATPATSTATDDRVLMRGGVVLRYFKVVNRDTYQPKANATVEVEVKGPTAPLLYTFTTDANGLIRDNVYPEGGMAFALDSSVPNDSWYKVSISKVDGQPVYCAVPTAIDVKVIDREYTRGLNAGASIAAEATALIGLQGKAGTGLETTVTQRSVTGRQKLAVKRTVNAGLGGQIGAEVGPSFKFGGLVTGELAAKIKGTATVIVSAENTHEFKYPANSTTLAQKESTAMGGLLIGEFAASGLGNPFIEKLIDVLVQQVTDLDSYKTSEAVNIGLEAGVAASAGATASFTPISKLGENFGDIDIGLDASLGIGASGSATIGVENKPIDKELIPNYLLKAQIDASAALGTGNVQPNWSQEKLRNVLKLREKLTGGMKGTTAGSWSAKLTLDRLNGYKPKKLVIAYSNVKSYGWKASGSQPGSTLTPVGGGTSSDTTTTTYTITDPVVIQKAIDTLGSITSLGAAARLAGAGAISGGVLLGPTVLVNETINLFDLISENDATYTIAAKKGDAIEFPFEIGLGAGAVLKLGAGVKFDRSIGYTTEKGVIKKGKWYPLEKYVPDNFIPQLPATTDRTDVDEMIQTGLDALANFGSAAISTVTTAVQQGSNTIRSLFTAELTFDGATAGTDNVALSSFHFNEIPGPVAPTPYRPSDVSGPAGKPHYGVGGFHQFSPGNTTLGSPATLKFFYDPDEVANIDASTLRIFAFDQDTEEWTPLPSTVDVTNGTVTTTVNKLALFTAAPPMPAGTITFTAQTVPSGTTEAPTSTITYTSDVIRMNTGEQVPDGTMFTVQAQWPGALGVPFGTITSADEGSADGVQVTSHSGRIQFTVVVPGTFGTVQVVGFSQEGTALARQLVPYQP